MSRLSYQFGYHLGAFVAQALKAMRDSLAGQSIGDTNPRPTMEELAHTPAMVRKGVKLNDWYNLNVTCPPYESAGKPPVPDSLI